MISATVLELPTIFSPLALPLVSKIIQTWDLIYSQALNTIELNQTQLNINE